MKILIFGDNGWIGNLFYQFINSLLSTINIVRSELRIIPSNYDKIVNVIKNNYVSHVFVAVGTIRDNNRSNTSVLHDTNARIDNNKTIDYIEDKLELNIQNNMTVQMIMCNIADKLKVHTTIIGTGCIYDDTQHLEQHKNSSHKYTEDDLPNYSGSKYSLIKSTLNNYIVMTNSKNVLHLRIRMPINNGCDDYDYIAKIIKYRRVIDVPNSITVLDDFYPIIFDMMCKYKYGTYNIVNPGIISPIEILELYKQIVDDSYTFEKITTSELHEITIGKRCNVELSTDKIQQLYRINISDIRTSIVRVLEQMKHLIKH